MKISLKEWNQINHKEKQIIEILSKGRQGEQTL